MTTVNGYTITPTSRGYEVRDRGALQGCFSSMGLAFSFAESAAPPPSGCPNCGKEMAHSSFYASEYCFHCHTLPTPPHIILADEVL